MAGAVAPREWRKGDVAIVEAFPATDGAAKSVRKTIDRLQDDVLPSLEERLGAGVRIELGGAPAEERDFVHAVYGKFPYALAFVVLLTFVLLMRAFRSVLLPLKAVILNLVSLGAASGSSSSSSSGPRQRGDLARALDRRDHLRIPLMIFAFLYGLSMDYEVFMLTRMREAYDETATPGSRLHSVSRERASWSRARPSFSCSRSSSSRQAQGLTSSSSGSGSPRDNLRRDGHPRIARACPDALMGRGTGGCRRLPLGCSDEPSHPAPEPSS